jgi:predicted RNase H-like HicB family nuclease
VGRLGETVTRRIAGGAFAMSIPFGSTTIRRNALRLLRRTRAGLLSELMKRGHMRYAVVIERAEGNFGAYVPDLPGCIATGATVTEVEAEIRDAIEFHLEGMREDGLPIPAPSSRVEYIEVAARLVLTR